MLSEDCQGRLDNWKFDQARDYLDATATGDERELVEALAATFGNSGWFAGSMGVIVGAAVEYLIGKKEE